METHEIAGLIWLVLLVAWVLYVGRRHPAKSATGVEQLRILCPGLALLVTTLIAYLVFVGLPWWGAMVALATGILLTWAGVNWRLRLLHHDKIPLGRFMALWIGK